MKAKISVELQKITPEVAAEWLEERWEDQRRVRKQHVAKLAADMNAGRFKVSPDAILRVRGKVANGQHRLLAVVQSGKPQQFLVLESNDEELYKVIDSGLRRTAADGLMGMPLAQNLPPIARWVKGYEDGNFYATSKSGTDHACVTQSEVIDYCISNQDALVEAASFVRALYEQTRLLPISIGGALYVIAAMNNKKGKAIEFLNAVYVEGGANAAGDLRNRLIINKGGKSKMPHGYTFAITLKAFRSFCNGTRPGVLKWANDEAIPMI